MLNIFNFIQDEPLKCSIQFGFKPIADLPLAMSDLQCAVIEDNVYVGGGTAEDKSDHSSQSQIFAYDQSHDQWTVLTQSLTRFFGLIGYKGKLITVGGMCAKHTISGDVNVFNFTTKTWDENEIPPIATKRFYPAVISHGSCLAVCGGVTLGGSTTDKVEVFVDGQWHRAPSIPHRICLTKPVVIDRSCYLIGGLFSLNPEAPSKAIISIPLSVLFAPPDSTATAETSWIVEFSDDSSTIHYRSGATNFGGLLLTIGGWSPSLLAPTTDIATYSSMARMWVKVDNLPQPRCSSGATALLQSGHIMVFGGMEKTAVTTKHSTSVLLMSLKL